LSVIELPVIKIEEETIGKAWEKTVLAVWSEGTEIRTEYGGSSKDSTVIVNIKNPLKEPRIHRGDYATYMAVKKGGYLGEVLEGTIDQKIGTAIHYTYHDRLFNYQTGKTSENLLKRLLLKVLGETSSPINQIDKIVEKLKEAPYSRRAQAITWYVSLDWETDSPPCLQRIWCRVIAGRLIMETTWRSRDLFHAWGSNAYAMTELQVIMAEEIGVEVGQYIDFSNSLHLYEKDYEEIEKFLGTLERRKRLNATITKT